MTVLYADQVDEDVHDDDVLRSTLVLDPDEMSELDPGTFLEDPDPGFEKPSVAEKVLGKKTTSSGRGRKPGAAVQKDIRAKVAMVLVLVGGMWQSRDEYCGSTLIQAAPPISEALADILCDSPDIVNWFTSSGKYMKWLNLAVAMQPIVAAVMGHHITHSVRTEPEAEPDWSMYRAGV